MDTFFAVRKQLLEAQTIEQEIAACLSLKSLYQQLLQRFELEDCYYDATRSEVDGGYAIAPKHAWDCLDDPLRTVRFIQGVFKAIRHLQQQFDDKPLEVLYAGCGPVAPLVLPLLGSMQKGALSLTLLDINQTSVDTVKSLVEHLGLSAYIKDVVQADAITYRHECPLHLLVSETMDKGLTNEPQIRIIQNLATQIHPQGLLLPQSIKLCLTHCDFAAEPYFIPAKQNPAQWLDTTQDSVLFEISKDIPAQPAFSYNGQWRQSTGQADIVIFAHITIYEDLVLGKGQSQISNPMKLAQLSTLSDSGYRIRHLTEGVPTWQILDS